MVTNQALLFLIFIVNGIIIGLLFDFFRILRRSFKTKDFITYIEDILFWVLTGLLLLYSIFTFNNGEIRLYMFIGAIFGCIIYMLSISNFIVKINTKIIISLKNILSKIINIIFIPFKFIIKFFRNILKKPISFIFINISQTIKNLFKNSKNLDDKKSKNQI